jgi:antitoxin (DNA-binding transcriptional repressor) of toxin-antitoxin stability system
MTRSIEIAEAEAQLAALADRAAAGEEIVLSRAGRACCAADALG